MELPKPEEVKTLMTAMSDRVQSIVEELVSLALDYGVHGKPMAFGEFSFQLTRVTRIADKWAVYVTANAGEPKDVMFTRIDEKLLFLEHSPEFVKAYHQRIVEVYDRLRSLTKTA